MSLDPQVRSWLSTLGSTGHSEGRETRHKQQYDCVVLHCDPEEGGDLRRRVDLNPVLFGSKTQELALEGEGRGRGTVFTTPMGPGDTDKTQFHMKRKTLLCQGSVTATPAHLVPLFLDQASRAPHPLEEGGGPETEAEALLRGGQGAGMAAAVPFVPCQQWAGLAPPRW